MQIIVLTAGETDTTVSEQQPWYLAEGCWELASPEGEYLELSGKETGRVEESLEFIYSTF